MARNRETPRVLYVVWCFCAAEGVRYVSKIIVADRGPMCAQTIRRKMLTISWFWCLSFLPASNAAQEWWSLLEGRRCRLVSSRDSASLALKAWRLGTLLRIFYGAFVSSNEPMLPRGRRSSLAHHLGFTVSVTYRSISKRIGSRKELPHITPHRCMHADLHVTTPSSYISSA